MSGARTSACDTRDGGHALLYRAPATMPRSLQDAREAGVARIRERRSWGSEWRRSRTKRSPGSPAATNPRRRTAGEHGHDHREHGEDKGKVLRDRELTTNSMEGSARS